MNKIYINHSSPQYDRFYQSLGLELVDCVEKADLVAFTGGADIDPDFYQSDTHPQTFMDPYRDESDFETYQEARFKNLPMIGICRGAQFLHAMNGGKLYQHCSGHTAPHNVYSHMDILDPFRQVTSTHHQIMAYPNHYYINPDFSPLAYSMQICRVELFLPDYKTGKQWLHKTDIDQTLEVCYWKHTKCFCFQPHPEHEGAKSTRDLFNHCISYTPLVNLMNVKGA